MADDRRQSFAADEGGEQQRLWVNLVKQGKFILLGSLLVWYFQTDLKLKDVFLASELHFSTRILSISSFILLSLTVVLFAVVMLSPLHGRRTDFTTWQQDSVLRRVIPALTFTIVAGFATLVLTLSPLFAPKPPPASLADRLTQASMLAGSSSSTSSKGVQNFVSQLAASLGMSSSGGARWSVKSTQDYLASLRTTDLVRAGLEGADAVASKLEVLAARLGVSRENTSRFAATLDVLQQRAQLWTSSARSHSPRLHQGVLGWIGALAGASGVFLLILGATGLLGVLVVPIRRGEQLDSVKTEQKKQR